MRQFGPGALEQRCKEQADVLDRAGALVKPGRRIAYITCSVLMEENDDQVRAFTQRHPEFTLAQPEAAGILAEETMKRLRGAALATAVGLQLTPRRTETDGFYLAMLKKSG